MQNFPAPSGVTKKLDAYKLVISAEILLFGVIMLLCGAGVIDVAVTEMWQPAFWILFGVICFTTGLMKKSLVAYWCAFPFFVLALAIILNRAVPVSYTKLYPLFIAIPAISSLFTLPLVKSKISHIKTIVFFGGITLIFLLDVVGGKSWAIIVPIFIIVAGAYLLINALISPQNNWEDFDFTFDFMPKSKEAVRELTASDAANPDEDSATAPPSDAH